MAWTAPMTATLNGVISSANFNTYIRDNLNQTLPGLSSAGNPDTWFISTGANQVTARTLGYGYSHNSFTDNSTGGAYVDLGMPSTTITTGTAVFLQYSFWGQCPVNNGAISVSVAVSGASTLAPGVVGASNYDGVVNGVWTERTIGSFVSLTAGSNTFKMWANSNGHNGSIYARPNLIVIPLN